MNTWFKSLLIGVAAAALAFFIWQKIADQNPGSLYTVHYTVEITPDEKGAHVNTLAELPAIIKRRCVAAGYTASFNVLKNSKELQINIEHVDDTIYSGYIITQTSTLEFRETYTLKEIPFFVKIFKGEVENEFIRSPDVIVPSDSTRSLIITESSPPAQKTKEYILDTLVKFGNVSSSDAYGPADLGSIYEKDTAVLNKLLQDPKTLERFPQGIKFCYGRAPYYKRNQRSILFIYAIRTAGQENSILQNKDVKSARVDYDQSGRPEVMLTFTSYGSAIWARMTRANIGRHIAILLDNSVMTAPIVNDAIDGGNSVINGGFSVDEATMLASQLNAGYIPAKLTIVKQDVTPESSGPKRNLIVIVALAFVLAAGLAWFIFNALKNR